MQDGNDRIKRRRLNGNPEAEDFRLSQELLLQGVGAGRGSDDHLTQLLLRQRLLAAAEQQQQHHQAADAGLALARADPYANTITATGGGGGGGGGVVPAGGGNATISHLLLNQRLQLQQAARLQQAAAAASAGAGVDDLSYLRAETAAAAAAAVGPTSLYGTLGFRGVGGASAPPLTTTGGPHNPRTNSLLLQQALGNESSASSLVDQISSQRDRQQRRGSDQLRASYVQSLLDAEREEAAVAAAAAAAAAHATAAEAHHHHQSATLRHLLGAGTGLTVDGAGAAVGDAGGSNSQASLLARLRQERAMAAAALAGPSSAASASTVGGGGGGGPLTPAALHSLIRRPPVGSYCTPTTPQPPHGLNPDYLLAARGGGGPSLGGGPPTNKSYPGIAMPGTTPFGDGRLPPPPGHPMHHAKKRPAPGTSAPKTTHPNSTGRQPIQLFMSCDMDDLSPYQCLVRKQIELFEAEEADAETNARGRNRPIVVGQVGIRCKHCKMLPPRKRERAAIYYPSKLDRLYQAGQTMASVHLGQHCNHIPEHLRQELARLREGKSAALAGKKYWSDGARALGVIEDDERLFFNRD